MKNTLMALTAAASLVSASESFAQALTADQCLANLLDIDNMAAGLSEIPGDVEVTLYNSLTTDIYNAIATCEKMTGTASEIKSMAVPSITRGNLTLVLPTAPK